MIIDSSVYNGVCTCGRAHRMETQLAVIEAGCLKDLKTYLERFGLNGYCTAVYDENTYKAAEGVHPAVAQEVILNPVNLHANEKGVELLMGKLAPEAEVLVAVGSGTIHDITRYCAYQKEIPFVSCPTAASVDGFCSSVAAMTWNGAKKTLTAVAPTFVLADIDIIKKAPIYLARSGFGDMIGKYIALADWKIANILTGEFYCDRIADMTAQATKAVLDSAEGVLKGEDAAFEKLIYGLLLSGLAMQMMGNSRPASGAEHHISHMIEMGPEGLGEHSEALHGEKVGVGTILASAEYHRLMFLSEEQWGDYPEITEEEIDHIFGERLTGEIRKENENDCASGITGERIRECLEYVRREVEKIPTAESLAEAYLCIGAKKELADIDVNGDLEALLLNCSPLVRNRLTLMRLRRCLK